MGEMWDLEREVDLEGGMRLRYEGEAALYAGDFNVSFPCKLELWEENELKVIDAVVKCEKIEYRDSGEQEIRQLREIPHHENLVRFYAGKVLKPKESARFGALLVFERMECNLEQLISNYVTCSEKCTLGDVISILQQILQGLTHLHGNGFLHMDLKPQNILISEGPEGKLLVKIAQFSGLNAIKDAKLSVPSTVRKVSKCLSPEVIPAAQQVSDSAKWGITEHADVYSFGKLMCTLFDAKAPEFISQDPFFVTQEIKVGDFLGRTVSCRAPKELCDLTAKCLQFDPDNADHSGKHGRPSLNELLSDLGKIKETYLSDSIEGTMVDTEPKYLTWDLSERVDLEGGTQLIYEGQKALGEGSYGAVFPCKLKLGKDQGHKVIDAVVKCEKKERSKDGFEIQKLREIPPHDNLVKFYDGKNLEAGESKDFGALFVLERMDCNLKQLISNYEAYSEKCKIGDVVSILQQIVQGLMHLKENGYIHMDLKPDNILVSGGSGGDILVKITDFGASKALEDGKDSVTATFRGSSAYMAPEVLLTPRFEKDSSRRITAHADVYSFGKLMCSLFGAKFSHFISQDSDFVTQEIKVGDVCKNRASCCAPKELCSLIENCLKFDFKNANDSRAHGRPSLNELLSALENIKETYPPSGVVGTMVPRASNTWGIQWDLGERIDLDGGKKLIYNGEGAIGEGSYGVILPCKLQLGEKDKLLVIDAVVKCEKKHCNSKDGYEIHKWKKIPPHDNIVRFYAGKVLEPGYDKRFGALFVLERMDCDLKELMFDNEAFVNSATYGDIVNILVQIAHGLKHLHSSGFLHMGINPQNILISKRPEGNLLVKIGDLGESKRLNKCNGSVTVTYRGSLQYMAPEVIIAVRTQDCSWRTTAQADVYSFGVLMLAIFNKQNPLSTSQARGSVGREILVGDISPYKVFCRAPPELCDLIEKCLRFEISKVHDSRLHGRPSLEEILEALKGMEECGWMNQTLQNQRVCVLPSGM